MKKIFIDSDVIVDFLTNRKPFCEHSSKILNLCIDGKIKGHITPVIISNLYYVLRKEIGAQDLRTKIKFLLDYLEIISMNKTIILKALNSDFNDFEDALQNFTVETNSDIKIILTRNVKDYKKSKLSVYTPQAFLKTIN